MALIIGAAVLGSFIRAIISGMIQEWL